MSFLRSLILTGAAFRPVYNAEGGAGGGGGDAGGGGGGARADGGGAGGGAAAGAAGSGGADAGAGAGGAAGGGAPATLAGGNVDPAAGVAAAAAAKAPFGEKWREDLAGDDRAALTDLAKYTDPKALYKSHRDLQAKISRGELRAPPAPMPKDGTPEQIAAWRQAQGLPDSAQTYVDKLELPDGVVVGDADKPLLGEFAKMAHAKGWTQAQMNDAASWWYDAQASAESFRVDQDLTARTNAQAELISEWGGQAGYKENMNAVGSFVSGIPEGLRDGLLTARLADGRMLGDTPEFNRWAAAMAREINPAASVVPIGDANAAKTITSELATLEAKMGDQSSDYWRGPNAAANQARYRELVAVQEKMQARGRVA